VVNTVSEEHVSISTSPLKMEITGSPETLALDYDAKRRHNPEDHNPRFVIMLLEKR
jgi:hypothetical protein